MLVAESSCGFPIFGNGRSSTSCGCTDSNRANWSCSKTRSPHSKDISLSQNEGRIYSTGVTGACCHCVECTCRQRSHCTTDVKVTIIAQLIVVTAVVEGTVVQDTEWPAWLMKATWMRLLKRAKGGRVKSSDACVSNIRVFTLWKLLCFMYLCTCVLCVHYFIHPSTAWGQCGTISLHIDDEKLSVGISYGCQVLGRVPYHSPLTHWDGFLEHTPSLDMSTWSHTRTRTGMFTWTFLGQM